MGTRAVLVIVGVLVALGAGEIGLRAAGSDARRPFETHARHESARGKFCEHDGVRGWRGIRNADGDFEDLDARHHVHQTHFGSRGTEVPLTRSSKRRIVVLGGSFVWGYGVDGAELFTELLARDTGDEVVNLGVPGYGADQAFLMFRQLGLQFRPNVVLLVATPSDDVASVLATERDGRPKLRFRIDPTEGLAMENFPVPQTDGPWNVEEAPAPEAPPSVLVVAASRSALIAAVLKGAGWLPPRDTGDEAQNVLARTPQDEATRTGVTMLGFLLTGLAADVKAAGAELVVTSVPTVVEVDDALRAEFVRQHPPPAGGAWDFDAPGRTMQDLCRRAGVRYVDLLPDLRSAARSDPYLYYRRNLHWTPAGHRVVAATLARALRAVTLSRGASAAASAGAHRAARRRRRACSRARRPIPRSEDTGRHGSCRRGRRTRLETSADRRTRRPTARRSGCSRRCRAARCDRPVRRAGEARSRRGRAARGSAAR
jgi:hypothetical protein